MNKKYLVALTVVALFATASVSANTAFKKITATERPDFKIVVNNDAVELQNNPIVKDGVTYLPVREVAELLNQDVNFDKGTITLTNKSKNEPTKSTEEVVNKELDNLPTSTENWVSVFELKKIYNVTETTRLPQDAEPTDDNRVYTITIDEAAFEFIIPKVVFGDFSVTNEDGIELRYINSTPHLHVSVIPSTT